MGMSGMSGMSLGASATNPLIEGPEGMPLVDWPEEYPPPEPDKAILSEARICHAAKFVPEDWHPNFLAEVVLAEFAASGWQNDKTMDPGRWEKLPTANGEPYSLEQEIRTLLSLAANQRKSRLPEIMAQAEDASPYWANLLYAGPAIRPATWTLLRVGQTVGLTVAMHFKYKYRRPRPVQVYAGLMPPIITPPHPSYPNAHALQSLLMSECAKLVCPHEYAGSLDSLARRVGHNREIAGLHFPTDRKASEHIAKSVMKLLRREGAHAFREIVNRAEREWRG